jgi:hypothetical protein
LLTHPLGRLAGVAERIVGVVAECGAAGRPIGSARNPQQLVQIDRLVDPGYEELAPFAGAQQVHTALQAQMSAGQHDDRIGRL